MFVEGHEGGAVISVKKKDLINKLRENRSSHEDQYTEALEGYKKTIEKALLKELHRVRHEGEFELSNLHLPEPEDHCGDYDRIIMMLEMCTKDEVFISEQEFSQYVVDNWHWRHTFHASTQGYLVAKVKKH